MIVKVAEGSPPHLFDPACLLAARFRQGKSFALVEFGGLTAAEQEKLAKIAAEPGFYGVLRPFEPGPLKAVNRDLALLLLTFGEAGHVPRFALASQSAEALCLELAALIADRVLEIEVGGNFISGALALEELGWSPRLAGEGTLAAKAERALRFAESLETDSDQDLADFLYGFGNLPLTFSWRRRFPGFHEVLEFLESPQIGGWQRRSPTMDFPWIGWQRSERTEKGRGPNFKLYISPRVDDLPLVFAELRRALPTSRAFYLKVGAKARSLLRTDKMVAYFDSFEDLADCADSLLRRLAGIPADGVPFSAQIDAAGLLSWGLDPWHPRSSVHRSSKSWRGDLVGRLARAMLEGRRQQLSHPAQWAKRRLVLEGVDVAGWRPGMIGGPGLREA